MRRNILLKDILIFWLRFIWKLLILRRPPNMYENKSLEGTPYSSGRKSQIPVAGERYVCESEWNAGISHVIISWGMTVKKRSKKIEKKALCPSVMVCLIEETMRNWRFDFSLPFAANNYKLLERSLWFFRDKCHLWHLWSKTGEWFFIRNFSGRVKNNGFKLKHGKIRFHI